MKPFSKIYALLCLVLFTQVIFSQIDSLKNLLTQNPADTQKLKLYKDLSLKITLKDMKLAEYYKDSAILLAKKINQDRFYAFAELADACLGFNKGQYKYAIKHFKLSNQLFGNSEQIAQGGNFSDMSYCYHKLGLTDSFYYCCTKAIKIYERFNREDKLVRTYGNMAYIFTNIGKYNDARKYFDLSNKYATKINDIGTIARNKQNMGVMYESLLMPDSALYFYKEGLKLKETLGDSLALSTSYAGIASIYLQKKDFNSFLKNERTYIAISRRMKNTAYVANGLCFIGQGFLSVNKPDSAIAYINQSLPLMLKIDDLYGISDCYQFLSESYDMKSDYKTALKYFKLYKNYYDSIYNSENAEQLENLKITFETEKKEQENKLLQTENILSNKTIKQQKLITYFIIGGFLIVTSLAFFIFKGLKKQRKANKIISLQKQEVETQKQKVEEHQKEIIDSINYASRIQRALLPSEKKIEKTFDRLKHE